MTKRRLLILVPAALVLAVYAYLGADYAARTEARDNLKGEIAEALAAMDQVGLGSGDLGEGLAEARTILETARERLPDSLDSTAVIEAVLDMAVGSGLNPLPLSTYPPTTEEIGEGTYQVMGINLDVTGNYAQLVKFLTDLESGDIKGLVVRELRIEGDVGQQDMMARLDLAVYAIASVPEVGGM
jgi:Tfp pilus assembly protein PilO